ncbi:MAG: AbrB/MazE/SpoVT family DNA-binding domain-containing protein [Balneola sp.]
MPSATITSKGQVTIPKKVRDKLHLKSGDTINFEVESANSARITSAKRSRSEAYGILFREDQKAYTVEEMDEGITEYLRKKYKKK